MQEEEKNNGMEGACLSRKCSSAFRNLIREHSCVPRRKNRAFARTEFFRMDKFGTYRLRILPIAPNPDGSPTRPGYEYPVHQLVSGAGETRYGEQAPKDVCHCHPRYRCRI